MLKKKLVIIAGCGYRQIKKGSIGNIFENAEIKVNMGLAVARILAEAGYNLLLLSRNSEKLNTIKKELRKLYPSVESNVLAVDLCNENEVFEALKKISFKDCMISYVQSVGLSASTYKIENDNPYLSLFNTPSNLPSLEFDSIVKPLLNILKGLKAVFKKQVETKVIIINSMSGVRPYPFGFSHTSAKGGLHNATRSICLELNKENVRVTEINPGIVDTGFYDNKEVRSTIKLISKEYGYNHKDLPYMSPYVIGNTVKFILENNAHFLTIDLVANGQIPHIGS